MADMNNFSEINQNFDTIKTLLNSIRAQGILNTSDVDKLLSGINSKLEKINTEEDIDLIKIFLSELKQNLDERHSVLVSKFGAIESLFSSLLKNSAEMPKATDIKELFDIVATNLSVFSREVVSQKESLTDITLRLDALRSDDTQKKDIIKNITLLKPDLERLNNGFDSIVLSLNDNFKAIVKTITTIDKTEYLENFSNNLNSIEMSVNTVLSALQMLDKKTEQVEDVLQHVATKDDIITSSKRLFDLTAQSHELTAAVTDLTDKYIKFDSLADKIDASVNIIATLKTTLEDTDDKNTSVILEQLRGLEIQLSSVASESKFEEFKIYLEEVLKNIANNVSLADKNLMITTQDVERLHGLINSLEINVNFQNILYAIDKVEADVKASINEVSQKLVTLQDANIAKVLNDISVGAESLGTKLNQAQAAIAILCEKNFGSVFENITDLKKIVSQIDENSVSANNAIFSNITDRLTIFENSLSSLLNVQEKTLNNASTQLVEQIDSIKNLSSILDYKLDSSVVEVSNIKREISSLQSSVEEMLALDFINVVKDFKVELYASKQELATTFDSTTNQLSDNFTNDLYGKYELLISKLDTVEEDLIKSQTLSFNEIKSILENISSSIIDVLSYVSQETSSKVEGFDDKLIEIVELVKENNINYVENIRDIVDTIREQVENNLDILDKKNIEHLNSVKRTISENTEDIRKEIKISYSKLIELQDSSDEIKDLLNINNINSIGKIESVLTSAETVKQELDTKLTVLKNALLDKIADFKQEFTCENADKVSELKFSVENLYNKNSHDVSILMGNLRDQLKKLCVDNNNSKTEIIADILKNFEAIKKIITTLNEQNVENVTQKVDLILKDFENVKSLLEKVDENIDGDMTRQMSIIESNFESLVSQLTILFDKSDKSLTDKINNEFENVSVKMQNLMSEKLENYKAKIEETFDLVSKKTLEQSKCLQDRISDLNKVLKTAWSEQAEINNQQINEMSSSLRLIIDENVKLTAVEYVELKNKLSDYAKQIETTNQALTQDLKNQLDDIAKYLNSLVDIQAEEFLLKQEEIKNSLESSTVQILSANSKLNDISQENIQKQSQLLNVIDELDKKTDIQQKEINAVIDSSVERIITLNESIKEISNEQLKLAENTSNDLVTITRTAENNNLLLNSLDSLARKQQEELLTKNESILNMAGALEATANTTAKEVSTVKNNLQSLLQVINLNKELLNNIDTSLSEKVISLKALTAEISAGELQTLDTYIEQILEQFAAEKQQIEICKDLILQFIQKELDLVSKNIAKETDVIIEELLEQFDFIKKAQAEDLLDLTSRIEDIINAQVYNNIEDLKSYLDIKTDNSVLVNKLDNLKIDMNSSVEEIISNLNKLLSSEAFKTTIEDYRVANEILINSTIDKINAKIEKFVIENGKVFEDKLALFDKKFVDTVVDKYEEVKLISNGYNQSLDSVKKSYMDIITSFETTKNSIEVKFENLAKDIVSSVDATNEEVRTLANSFENLRSQISNKSFDEAFQASINKQISSLESLICEQLGYIEDINELCINNLPDVSELKTIVKYSILDSINNFTSQINVQNIDKQLNDVKSEIITQFLNVFNQISFIAEQEEILDFIQDKHDELITVLSHIVTSSTDVKENLIIVDDKIDSLKEEIAFLNDKISSIMSSDGDIDYVYSLQELESDIASLRLALNEIKGDNFSDEFANLLSSTDEIYNLVESIKTEFPTKKDFESIAEDIVSISTRTNKLILASDESYKSLQDNLQDFKLVINDLDERTRNFAQEAGMDRIDSKLNALNSMMINGAKTNQVFNQIFEYLAEWVDNASTQINAISGKVETLDDIGQIKLMLADLKAGAEDNSESIELIEALGAVFDKQAKKISSLEAKLDKIIVETTINNKNSKLDLSPMEDTLNRFLVAMDEKMLAQQNKINSLETKIETIMNALEEKDTATLTKKVGGMDRQIAKLNKNIEKIASHVVEK